MKTLILSSLMLFCSLSYAQDLDIPEDKLPKPVLENFKKLFPKAMEAEWDKFPEFYEVDFLDGKVEKEAIFGLNGDWLITERTVPHSKLPQAVKDGLAKSKYADYKIRESAEVEMPGLTEAYGVDVAKGKDELALYFDKTGKIIKVTED
jgi:hypothetical protein